MICLVLPFEVHFYLPCLGLSPAALTHMLTNRSNVVPPEQPFTIVTSQLTQTNVYLNPMHHVPSSSPSPSSLITITLAKSWPAVFARSTTLFACFAVVQLLGLLGVRSLRDWLGLLDLLGFLVLRGMLALRALLD